MTVCVSLSLRGRINGGGEPLAVRAPLMNGRKSLACGVITGSAMHGAAMYDATLRPAIDHQCCIRRGRRLLLASLHKLSYSLVMRQAAAGPRCIPKTCMILTYSVNDKDGTKGTVLNFLIPCLHARPALSRHLAAATACKLHVQAQRGTARHRNGR